MNIYDTKVITCVICKKQIGETEFESVIVHSLCGECVNPLPEGEKTLYTVSYYQNKSLRVPQGA